MGPGQPDRPVRSAPPAPEPLRPLVDAHTHLDACGATDAASVRALLDRAEAVGVGQVVTVADDLASARWVTAAADADPRVWAATALHPTRANKLDQQARAELDHYWPGKLDGCATPAQQEEAFRWHIDLAKRVGKPVMIHDRDAHTDVLRILSEEGPPESVIFHCFSGDAAMARQCVDAGYVLSLSGTVSFRNAHAVREAAPLVPGDQLMVETDAPFLTPHPHRGSANEPYCLPYTVQALAQLRNQDPQELAAASTATARGVYRL